MVMQTAVPFRLGKAPPKIDIRTCRLEFFMAGLPEPPAASSGKNRALMASCGMLGNDQAGDCVVADDGHRLELWTKLTPTPSDDVMVTTAEALSFYQMASLALNHSSADQGLVMLDYNKWRMQTSWKDRQFYGFGTVDHFNHRIVKQLIIAFDAIPLGVALPITAQSQPAPGGTWTLVTRSGPGTPRSWGGHDVPAIDYDEGGVYVVTWGGVQYLTWDFFDYYVDECYGVIPTDPVPGFDLVGFVAYLQAIGAYIGPTPAPDPPSPPAPHPSTASMAIALQPADAIVGIKAPPFTVAMLLPDGTLNTEDNSTVVTAQLVGYKNRSIATANAGIANFQGDSFVNPHAALVYNFSASGLPDVQSLPFAVTSGPAPPPPPPPPATGAHIVLSEADGRQRGFTETQ